MSRPIIRLNRPGFTMVELLVVIVIIALLLALLLPAINGAVRSARNAAVSAEINQLSQALADFKSKYGDYPPSRILLSENGDYGPTTIPAVVLAGAGQADITSTMLAQRSVGFLRKFWPKVAISTSGPIFPPASTVWYDFNGNGLNDGYYIVEGHEALVFFLGGLPVYSLDSAGKPVFQGGVTGFNKNPQNPFLSPLLAQKLRVSADFGAPLFEFNGSRLLISGASKSGIPGYVDSLGPPQDGHFYAYFSSYGNNSYDPNDVNFVSGTTPPVESDNNAVSPLTLRFHVNFPVYDSSGASTNNIAISAVPNPYSSTPTYNASVPNSPVTYQKPNSFQIISAGGDGQYGIGGLYNPSGSDPLPVKDSSGTPINMGNSSDAGLRVREMDNLTNFRNGRLD